jgi:hypothetical protein
VSEGELDRRAIARDQRRRQAVEALEFERARAEALREQLDQVVTEAEGQAVDELAFAAMAPDDVEVVRAELYGSEPAEPDPEWDAGEWEVGHDDPEPDPEEAESEIARLQEEIAASRRRQQAFERYLAALDDGSG